MKRLFLCKLWVKLYLQRLRDFVKGIVLSFPLTGYHQVVDHFNIYYLSCPFIFMLGFLSKFQSVHLLSLCSTVFYQTNFQTVFNILQACVCHFNLKQCPSYVCFSLLKGNPSWGMKCGRPHLQRGALLALEECKIFSKQSQPLQKPRQRCRK